MSESEPGIPGAPVEGATNDFGDGLTAVDNVAADDAATVAGVPVAGAEPAAQDAHGGSIAGSRPGSTTGNPEDRPTAP